MPDSFDIDDAIVATLLADTGTGGLMTLMSDGVYVDEAKQGATKFVIVSLLDEADEGMFGGRAYEDALYLVKAVALGSSGADVKAAAARIDLLLEGQPLDGAAHSPVTPAGYTWMTTHREARIRFAEVDDVDPSIRWQHCGGHYRVQYSVG